MDAFVTIVKSKRPAAEDSTANNATRNLGAGPTRISAKGKLKYSPYPVSRADERKSANWKEKKRVEKILAPLRDQQTSRTSSSTSSKPTPSTKPPTSSTTSTKAITRHLLATLKDESNPITHPTGARHADYVDSCVTGHQRGEGRAHRPGYLESRARKLEEQLPQPHSSTSSKAVGEGNSLPPLHGVRVYINGYCEGTTDTELKRLAALGGARVQGSASGATHVLTSMQLSAAKMHKWYHSTRNKPHILKPAWLSDSVAAFKRLPEAPYSILADRAAEYNDIAYDVDGGRRVVAAAPTARSIVDMFNKRK